MALFSDPQIFEIEYFDRPEDIATLQSVADEYDNPELINQGVDTAPSKRIIKVRPNDEGNKPAISSIIAEEIGIDAIRFQYVLPLKPL